MLNLHRSGLIGKILKGDYVLRAITRENQGLRGEGRVIVHATLRQLGRGGFGHGHDFRTGILLLRIAQRNLRTVVIDIDVLYGIGRLLAVGVVEDDCIASNRQGDALLGRVHTIAADSQRVFRDLLLQREALAGHGLGISQFRIGARFPILHRIGQGIHLPVRIDGHVVGNGLVNIEQHITSFACIPAIKGITIASRRRYLVYRATYFYRNGRFLSFFKNTLKFQRYGTRRHFPVIIQCQARRHLVVAIV